jgi:hypothetical protein
MGGKPGIGDRVLNPLFAGPPSEAKLYTSSCHMAAGPTGRPSFRCSTATNSCGSMVLKHRYQERGRRPDAPFRFSFSTSSHTGSMRLVDHLGQCFKAGSEERSFTVIRMARLFAYLAPRCGTVPCISPRKCRSSSVSSRASVRPCPAGLGSLGGVDEFEPISGGCDMDHAQEGFGELVIAGGDSPVDLEVAEHALDAVALFVEGAIMLDLHAPV